MILRLLTAYGLRAITLGLATFVANVNIAEHVLAAMADAPVVERLGRSGEYPIIESEALVVEVQDRPEPLIVNATYPTAEGRYPVIVFSHGNFCAATRYDKIIRHWVSHGYVVLQPWHLDAAPFDPEFLHSQHRVWITRMIDMQAVLDVLIFNGRTRNTLSNKIDTSKVIAAGHSYGALTAQSTAGARTRSRDGTATVIQIYDRRISAVIAISPPGEIEGFVDEATASAIRVPMLVTTGTRDFSDIMWPDWQAHRLTYDTAPKGGKSLLVLNGGDHYLGGLICLERDTPDQSQTLSLLNAVTIAFLNSHVAMTSDLQTVSEELKATDTTAWSAALEMK